MPKVYDTPILLNFRLSIMLQVLHKNKISSLFYDLSSRVFTLNFYCLKSLNERTVFLGVPKVMISSTKI